MAHAKLDGHALQGVSATALFTLSGRAAEAARPDGLIHDPRAIQLREQIEYDYEKFHGADSLTASHAMRASLFDLSIKRFLLRHPGATVVALAEGLQTTFWRVGDPDVRWISLDLAPVIAVREQLLPAEPQITHAPMSALDRSWFDLVPPDEPVFISAEGLFMYFQPEEVFGLIRDCAKRFRGGELLFDAVPPWVSSLSGRASHLGLPALPFGATAAQLADLPKRIPDVRSTSTHRYLGGGRAGWAFDLGYRFTPRVMPWAALVRFHEHAAPDAANQ